jgi:hypothetical protein
MVKTCPRELSMLQTRKNYWEVMLAIGASVESRYSDVINNKFKIRSLKLLDYIFRV